MSAIGTFEVHRPTYVVEKQSISNIPNNRFCGAISWRADVEFILPVLAVRKGRIRMWEQARKGIRTRTSAFECCQQAVTMNYSLTLEQVLQKFLAQEIAAHRMSEASAVDMDASNKQLLEDTDPKT